MSTCPTCGSPDITIFTNRSGQTVTFGIRDGQIVEPADDLPMFTLEPGRTFVIQSQDA